MVNGMTYACVGALFAGVACCFEKERSRLLGRRDDEWSLNDRLEMPADDLPARCLLKLSVVLYFRELNMVFGDGWVLMELQGQLRRSESPQPMSGISTY